MSKKITYEMIQDLYQKEFGIIPKTCWIADAKRKNGLAVKVSKNRINKWSVKNFCPQEKEQNLINIFKKVGILK